MKNKRYIQYSLECLIGLGIAVLVVYMLVVATGTPQFVYGKY